MFSLPSYSHINVYTLTIGELLFTGSLGPSEGFFLYYRWINHKINLFSGASSGIGAGTAILFCKLGAQVAITGRNVENLSKTADECEKSNGKKVIIIGQKNICGYSWVNTLK